MKISFVVAASTNNVIGVDGDLPWRLPEDLKKFKSITMGKPMIMGRATYDSIGRALPGRQSIVLTRQKGFRAEGCDVATSIEDALKLAGDAEEVMVIGGGKIYEQFLPMADRIYLTRVNATVEGDTYFPQLDNDEWQMVESENFPAVETPEYGFVFETWERN